MKIIDLTLPWSPRTTPVTGLPAIHMEPLHTHRENHRSNTLATFSIHTGTHVDAPYHFDPDGSTVETLPIDGFVGSAVKIDVSGRDPAHRAITAEDLTAQGVDRLDLRSTAILLLATHWAERHWDQPDFYTSNPFLDEKAAALILQAAPKAVAVDFSVDDGEPYPNHRTFLGSGIPLIENLTNLDAVPASFFLAAVPLPIDHGDGSPVRAYALV